MTPPKLDRAHRAWLTTLRIGDEVAWISRYSPARIVRIVQIDGHFIVDDEPAKERHCRATFTRLTGKGRSGTFRPTTGWIVPVTDDLRKEHAVEVARQRLCAVQFNRSASNAPSSEKILAIASILWPEDFGDSK
jgi:hypothetical protein